MLSQQPLGWGEEFERIRAGGLPTSTETRLGELRSWGGFTSFLTAKDLAVGIECGVRPIGQVIGLSAGRMLLGVIKTTHAGQGRRRAGVARWLERSGPVQSWTEVRRRALARLADQAERLDANAVIGIRAAREETGAEGQRRVVMQFTGTAVQVDRLKRGAGQGPVLTMASTQELWLMLEAGMEPVGIAGAFACVDTYASLPTRASGRWWWRVPNVELQDLTKSVYEVRRLALERLRSDARALHATGLLDIDLVHEQRNSGDLPGLEITAHVLASAVRVTSPRPLAVKPTLAMRGAHNA